MHMCGFNGMKTGNYFGGEPIRRTEVEVRNGKAAGKDEVIGEMVKVLCDMVMDWIWRLCNMAFETGVVPENWITSVIVPLYKGNGEMTECKNYRGICQLSLVGKIYAGILTGRVSRMTERLIDDE